MKPGNLFFAFVLLLPLSLLAQDKPTDVDWDKARSLLQREQRGDKLAAEEQTYLDHAKVIRRQMQAQGQIPPGRCRGLRRRRKNPPASSP